MARLSVKYLASGSLRAIVRGRVAKARMMIGKAMVQRWREAVDSTALSTRAKARIKQSIVPYSGQRAGAYIGEKVAKLLELGWKPFDMKPGLLAGMERRVIPMQLGEGTVFRTVSGNSKPDSWIHPGFKGARTRHKVVRSATRLVREALKNASG